MVEWQVNEHLEDFLCPHRHFPDNEDRDSPQNFCWLTVQPLHAAASPKIFYRI
jgi:hypothetical protein